MSKKKSENLIEQRESIQDAMKKALTDDNMAEYDRLNGHLIWIEKKIRKDKNDRLS